MKFLLTSMAALLLISFPLSGAPANPRLQRSKWEQSIVVLDATRKQYDFLQPWSKRMKSTQKVGLILENREILTTADEMFDRTLIRVQKNGRGQWWSANLKWIDYHANLALLSVEEDAELFWKDLAPVEFSDWTGEDLSLARWREGKLEMRKAEFNQFTVKAGHLTYAPQVQFELNSEMQGAGWGEPVIAGGNIVGLLTGQQGNNGTALPSSFIRSVLDARKAGSFRGLGFFDFYWQPAVNPSTLDYLKLSGPPRGVIVHEVPFTPGVVPVVKPRDVILQVDGFDIDIQGDYEDPLYGHLSLENLATRNKWAGDEVKIKIWRDAKEIDLSYRLPKADYSTTLVPDAAFDQEPEYLVAGGLVFQPLIDPYLQSWGPDWKRRAPFRLNYFNQQSPTAERPALVILSQVLPDVYNIGYQELRYLVLDEVNGRKIGRLSDLKEALKHPSDGFHSVLFMKSDSLRRLVLNAADIDQSTQRVLRRYGIASESFIAPADPKTAAIGKP